MGGRGYHYAPSPLVKKNKKNTPNYYLAKQLADSLPNTLLLSQMEYSFGSELKRGGYWGINPLTQHRQLTQSINTWSPLKKIYFPVEFLPITLPNHHYLQAKLFQSLDFPTMNWILAEMGAEFWTVETMRPVRRTDEDRVNNKKNTLDLALIHYYTHIFHSLVMTRLIYLAHFTSLFKN